MHEEQTIKNFIKEIEQKLHLSFIEEEEGNICLANRNSDLRDEFKQSFTRNDLHNYLKAAQPQSGDSIPLPENATIFWAMVEKGKEI